MVIRPRRNRRLGLIVLAVFLLFLILAGSSRFYTDILWFREIGFESVLWKSLRTQFLLGGIVGALVTALVYLNLRLAGRARSLYRITNVESITRPDPFDRYRDQITPYIKWLALAVAAVIGFLSGLSASGGWRTFLLWINRVSFGVDDPQFGRDISFYVFELPLYNFALSWLWFAILISLLATLVAYYFYGAIRPDGGLAGVDAGAVAHVSVLLGFLALVKAVQYWLGRYGLNFSDRGVVTGASYTDVNAQLPALTLLAIISVISAALFLVNIRFRRISLPLAAVGIWILTSVLAGGVWPFVVQRFSVEPQELQRERGYIERNLAATRTAFGLADVKTETFAARSALSSGSVQRSADILQNIRLWDPDVLEQAYAQVQAIRTYYQFQDVDIDRYRIDNVLRQVLLSVRELSIEDLQDRTWSNEHLQYTHGYGVVASLANEATASGQPTFLVKDVPGTVAPGASSLESDQLRSYFGEAFDADEYSVVDTEQEEVDYPTADGVQRSQYDGSGGVPLGSFFTRLAFAIREGDPNLILSGLITDKSQIVVYRNVRARVLRAAPFLSLDHDPYPAVVDGRLVWILDAYTSTQYYPYSQRFTLDEAVPGAEAGGLEGRVNYIRNSVKVVVDAYDGTMEFHIVDETDPLIEAWRNAFPDLFTADEPTDDLRAHFRFPEDLFNVQSQVFSTYHINDAANFYAKEDAWSVPEGAQEDAGGIGTTFAGPIPPTYLLFQLPGESEQEFMLTRPFTPATKNNMIALMVARSDPEHYGELVTLQFPSQSTVLGPTQVDNLINQDVETSRALTLLGQRGSTVSFGSLVTLPIEESILYIQPLFVQADDGGIPELKKVILVSGGQVIMENGFEAALSSLFGLEQPPPVGEPPPPPGGGDNQPQQPQGELGAIVAQAGRVYQQAQEALAAGDFETYGRLIERLGDLLDRAEQLSQTP
ncbi:MAG: UPF0182 family protein [Actinobacteria bacterium]|nr:UPF0182 family protein [Actinomycetota bacterium]